MNTSKVVSSVMEDLLSREARGLNKYGTNLDRTDLSRLEWLQHHYEELLDAACYVKKQILMENGK